MEKQTMLKHNLVKIAILPFEVIGIALLLICAVAARSVPKKIDIGLGPLPLINNIYHKKVFQKYGYTAETFVNQIWHITSDFDVRSDQFPLEKIPKIGRKLNIIPFTIWVLFRYRCLLIYFNGGSLGIPDTFLLWRVEPFIYFLAGIKTIVLAYGADVQDMSRSQNLLFKHAMSKDYPLHQFSRKKIADKIDLWTTYGSHVVGGCEWVDYMHHWDTLMISHFSIDTADWAPLSSSDASVSDGPFKILHAPNHREIKGTPHILRAVEELKAEGLSVELILAEKKPNHEIRELIRSSDVVIDQLVVGWYAMFAIETMALGKPVICNMRQDLENLYRVAGLYDPGETIALIHACPLTIKDVLRRLYYDRKELEHRAAMGRTYVQKHHSIDAVGKIFSKIAHDLIGAAER